MIEKLEEDISRNALAPAGVNPDEVADNRAKLERSGNWWRSSGK